MSIANTYPVFQADQVLTNKHLNDLFNYLDEQERLTKSKLLGDGIVCGLEIAFTGSAINISKGCGLTSQGYTILLCDHTGTNGYTYYMPFTRPAFPNDLQLIVQCGPDPDINHIPFYASKDAAAAGSGNGLFLLLTDDDFDALDATDKASAIAISQSTVLSQYIVVLFLDVTESSLKNCDTNDCNDKGSLMDFVVQPLLVSKKLLATGLSDGKNGNSAASSFQPVELKRYNVPFQNLNSSNDVLNAFLTLLDDATLKLLANDMTVCFQQYGYLLDTGSSNPFSTFFTDFKGWLQVVMKQQPILIQYFYDFIDDLIKAFYEFRYKLRNLNVVCCGNEMQFPCHLMLGVANINTSVNTQSAYRQYFIYSPLFDAQNEGMMEVRSLLRRMELMVEGFLLKSLTADAYKAFVNRAEKITPSRYGHPFLSERCIPYYYDVADEKNNDVSNDLYYYWNARKTSRGEATTNLSYNAASYSTADYVVNPLYYDIEPFNFFRVEGHIGKQINTALSNVKSIQQQMNLPFDVIALSADYIGAFLKGEDPECAIQDLESDYRILIAEFICKLHDVYCFVSKVAYLPSKLSTAAPVATTKANARSVKSAAAKATSTAAESAKTSTNILASLETISLPVDHPFVAGLVNEFQAAPSYVKGTTLLRLCAPEANTIGTYYINMLQKTAYKNPVPANAAGNNAVLFHFFEFVDSVESMLSELMSNDLSALNTTTFKLIYSRYETEIKTLNGLLLTLFNNLDKATESNPAIEYLLDMFVDNVQIILHTCITEKLEAIKTEYLRRLAQYRLAQNFNYYFKMHGGIEHKAGVPRGGTFILVYHEERRNRFVDVNAVYINRELSNVMSTKFSDLLKPNTPLDSMEAEVNMLAVATLNKDPALYLRFKDLMQKYLDDCKDLPPGTKTTITTGINQPPETTGFTIPDGMVIADFYVPYLCCSDCPPVAYILTESPTLSLDNSEFCSNDKGPYTIHASPAGGVIKVDNKQLNDTNFIPSAYSVGSHSITYTVNDKTISISIVVVAVPKITLTNEPIQPNVDTVVFKVSSSARPGAVYNWDYGDGTTLQTTDLTQLSHNYVPTQQSQQYTVTLTVTDGPCKASAKPDTFQLISQVIE